MKIEQPQIFLLDDDLSSITYYTEIIKQLGYTKIKTFLNKTDLLQNSNNDVALIFMDYYLEDSCGKELFKEIQTANPNSNIIVISSQTDIQLAVDIIAIGAFDYLRKGDKDDERLCDLLNKWENYRENKDDKNYDFNALKNISNLITETESTIKKEISSELHDNIAQLLIGTKLLIEMALKSNEKQHDLLANSKEYIITAIKELRLLSHRLLKESQNAILLSSEINKIITPLKLQKNIKIIDNIDVLTIENNLETTTKINVIRIIQEITNNAMKYAKASKLEISIKPWMKYLKINIKDNGIGFIEDNNSNDGIGMQNIKGRIKKLNGQFKLISTINRGCTWQIKIPL